MTNRIAIYRAEKFSPNSIERDRAIMNEACGIIGGFQFIKEEDIKMFGNELRQASLILSMARGKEATDMLRPLECNTAVVNSAKALSNSSRSVIDRLMRNNNLPAAPLYNSTGGWWIKRGDEAAQQKSDVAFARDAHERDTITEEFRKRGITDIVITAHVEGDLVKFYGVEGTTFFHTSYPTEKGFSKFGNESINGTPCHTPFSIGQLHDDANKLSELTGIRIYGGDCIVRPDGTYAIIDFNDWPSFSPCRRDAAKAIAQVALRAEKEKAGLNGKEY